MSKIKIIRHLIQLTFFIILILPVFFLDTLWYGTYISGDLAGVELTDPLTAVELTFASKSLWVPLLLSAVPLTVIAILGGRLFCSFVCPLNALLEILPNGKRLELDNRKWPLWSLLCVLILALLVGIPSFNVLSPVYALMRILIFGFGIEAVLVLAVVIAGMIWGNKIWCRTICPLGAMYGILGSKRLLRVVADENKCIKCGRCDTACSMGTSPCNSDFNSKFTCTNCGDCISSCPKGAISYKIKG